MELELRIIEVDPDYRWNWQQWFERDFRRQHARRGEGRIAGSFVSFRDDRTFVWAQTFQDGEERLRYDANPMMDGAPSPILREEVRHLAPVPGSTIARPEDFARVYESPVLEIRHYRLRPGTRERFTSFLRDKTMAEQLRLGMPTYGPFDSLDDENVLGWLRGFPSLLERDRRKAAFYQSAFWLALQDEAFSMIEDYSNVLLVTPVPLPD